MSDTRPLFEIILHDYIPTALAKEVVRAVAISRETERKEIEDRMNKNFNDNLLKEQSQYKKREEELKKCNEEKKRLLEKIKDKKEDIKEQEGIEEQEGKNKEQSQIITEEFEQQIYKLGNIPESYGFGDDIKKLTEIEGSRYDKPILSDYRSYLEYWVNEILTPIINFAFSKLETYNNFGKLVYNDDRNKYIADILTDNTYYKLQIEYNKKLEEELKQIKEKLALNEQSIINSEIYQNELENTKKKLNETYGDKIRELQKTIESLGSDLKICNELNGAYIDFMGKDEDAKASWWKGQMEENDKIRTQNKKLKVELEICTNENKKLLATIEDKDIYIKNREGLILDLKDDIRRDENRYKVVSEASKKAYARLRKYNVPVIDTEYNVFDFQHKVYINANKAIKRYEEKDKEIMKLKEELFNLKKEGIPSKDTNLALEKTKNEFETKYGELKDKYNIEISIIKKECEDLKYKNNDLKQNNSNLSTNFDNSNKLLFEQVKEQNKKIKELTEKINNLSFIHQKEKEEHDELLDKWNKITIELAYDKNKINSLEQEKEKMEVKFKNELDEKTRLVDRFNIELKTIKDKYKESEQQILVLKKEIDTQKERYQQLQITCDTTIKNQNSELNELLNKNKENQKQREKSELYQELQLKFAETVKKNTSDYNELFNENKENKNQIEKLKLEIENYKSKYEKEKDDLYKDIFSKFSKQLEDAQKELETTKKRFSEKLDSDLWEIERRKEHSIILDEYIKKLGESYDIIVKKTNEYFKITDPLGGTGLQKFHEQIINANALIVTLLNKVIPIAENNNINIGKLEVDTLKKYKNHGVEIKKNDIAYIRFMNEELNYWMLKDTDINYDVIFNTNSDVLPDLSKITLVIESDARGKGHENFTAQIEELDKQYFNGWFRFKINMSSTTYKKNKYTITIKQGDPEKILFIKGDVFIGNVDQIKERMIDYDKRMDLYDTKNNTELYYNLKKKKHYYLKYIDSVNIENTRVMEVDTFIKSIKPIIDMMNKNMDITSDLIDLPNIIESKIKYPGNWYGSDTLKTYVETAQKLYLNYRKPFMELCNFINKSYMPLASQIYEKISKNDFKRSSDLNKKIISFGESEYVGVCDKELKLFSKIISTFYNQTDPDFYKQQTKNKK